MSDRGSRLIAASILAAAGGVTFGLGTLAEAIRPSKGESAIIYGLILLAAPGTYAVWHFVRPLMMRDRGAPPPAGTARGERGSA